MDTATLFLLVVTALCCYCTGASWMLQIVCYPTYALVGAAEFVPFHVSFGRRLIAAAVGPMVITCWMTFALVFLRPAAAPLPAALLAAACGLVILVTTIVLEVPKHLALDRDGKSDALINGLVRDNLPRMIAWTVASVALLYQVVVVFQAMPAA
ncbi:MAG: hypothetical protein H7Y11_12505 [Armatimonadetes bacterium]|nr:hypothetical protein [Anaerolineae bacterium]